MVVLEVNTPYFIGKKLLNKKSIGIPGGPGASEYRYSVCQMVLDHLSIGIRFVRWSWII